MSNKHLFPFVCSICYPIKDNRILLQKKRRGFGKGNWNGPGGKVEPDESPRQSAIRELKEETNLEVLELKKIAEIEFIFTENEASNNYVYVYICKKFSGKPQDLGEGKLKWFKFEEIPYDLMWDDDKHWLPKALAGEFQKLRFYFDKNKKVLKYEKI